MKSLLFSAVLFLFFFTAAFSQRNFAPLGAEWKFEGYMEGCCNYKWFKVESEVEIGGKLCGVVRRYAWDHFANDFSFANDSLIVWEENGRVFFYDDLPAPQGTQQFYLLCDFNLQTGDTLEFFVPHNADAFSIWDQFYEFNDGALRGPFRNLITGTDTVTAPGSGTALKRLYHFPLDEWPPAIRTMETVVQRIGSLEGLAGSDGGIIPNDGSTFICYQDSAVQLFNPFFNGCDFLSAVREQQVAAPFHIYPNPVTGGILHIESDYSGMDPKNLRIRMFDMMGREVKTLSFAAQIDVSDLRKGFYFMAVEGQAGRVFGAKIIVM
ncbi:MAG: T9SS type A sorting domain-containing protein [Saprospiraceae bacterium]